MTHLEQLEEFRNGKILAITNHVKEHGNVKLVDLDNEDWREDEDVFDSFYELPQEQVQGKYYALPHYIHYVGLDDGKLYFNGLEDESNEGFVFEVSGLFTDTLCQIADLMGA